MKWFEIQWNGSWAEVDLRDIKKGEVFRVIENGIMHREKATSEFKATSDAYYCHDWEAYMIEYDCFYGGNSG